MFYILLTLIVYLRNVNKISYHTLLYACVKYCCIFYILHRPKVCPVQKTLYIPVIQIPNHIALYMSKMQSLDMPIIGPLFHLRAFVACSSVNFTFMDFINLYTEPRCPTVHSPWNGLGRRLEGSNQYGCCKK